MWKQFVKKVFFYIKIISTGKFGSQSKFIIQFGSQAEYFCQE